MSDTITRWECSECGRVVPDIRFAKHQIGALRGVLCPGVPVERTYVLEGASEARRYDFACAAVARELAGVPEDFPTELVTPEDWARARRLVTTAFDGAAKAINAVTGES